MKNVEDIYELSPMQQGMFFHTISDPKSGMYCEQPNFTINGVLDTSAFKQAWQKIVARHPILRTSFYWSDLDKPVQVVTKQIDLPWSEYDWSNLSPNQQQTKLQSLLEQDRQQGFQLNQKSPIRFFLIRLTATTHQFVWSFHHLLLDGWSMPILLKEMLLLYEAFNRGENLSLPRLRPYRDYIAWLQQQDSAAAQKFWTEKLQGFCAPTPLVVDEQIASASNTDICQEYHFQLSTVTTTALKALAKKNRLTINTIVQGVWALLLSRYSGETDIVFGSTLSGRNIAELPGIESMVGIFINTLPLRVQVNPEAELWSWLQNIQMQQIEKEDYAYTPLFKIQQWSDVPGGMNLFDSIIVFENYSVNEMAESLQKSSIEISQVKVFEQTNYPLTITAIPKQELSILISYHASRFLPATIARMGGHFQALLEEIVANPQQQLGELPLITASEKERLLEQWNNTTVDYPHLCFPHLFEQQVTKTPNAVAVKFQEQELTYLQLKERANQLAHYLQTLGVKPEVKVGIYINRSLEMLIGLLGVLKAGGAYVPLDPNYPPERIAYMLNDSKVSIVLTQEKLQASLPENNARLICLDTDWNLIAQESSLNPITESQIDNLAYVIYTSGSTGKPKGVLIEHRGLSNFLTSMKNEPGLSNSDILVAVTTISFDIAALELYLPLIVGAKVIIASRETASDAQQLWSTIINNQATVMQATPATWRMLLSVGWQYRQPLKILCGGEALSSELAQELLAKGSSLWNLYGPTETTIWSAVKQIESDDTIVVGCPIANTQIYILDKQLQPVPIGVAGEVYIGGEGLARGYLNRDDLTQEKFIDNPFLTSPTSPDPAAPPASKPPSPLLYKTEDLAKYLPNGDIKILGRIDNQVKIRGFRIELGEIEFLLAQHPALEQNVVIAREDVPGDKRLVAYGVVKQNQTLSNEEIHRFLLEKLPGYMIPRFFVRLETLPLTPNGKIDRRALPRPEINRSSLETVYIQPKTEIETKIAAVWQEVLKIEKPGIYDNFFDLGGHSLLIAQVQGKLEIILEEEISMLDLFTYPSIHALAEHLTSKSKEELISNRAKQRSLLKTAVTDRRQLRQQRRKNNQ